MDLFPIQKDPFLRYIQFEARSFSFFNFRIFITTVAPLFFPQTTLPNKSVVFSRPAPKINIGMFMLTSSNSGKRTSPFVLVSVLKKMQVAFCHCPSCLSQLWWQPAFVHFFLLPKCEGINWHWWRENPSCVVGKVCRTRRLHFSNSNLIKSWKKKIVLNSCTTKK